MLRMGGIGVPGDRMGGETPCFSGSPFNLEQSVYKSLIIFLADEALQVLQDDSDSFQELVLVRVQHQNN
jgi:hypothetical protein